MNKLKDTLYTIMCIIMFFAMLYSFAKGDIGSLILSSTFFIYSVITAYYDGLRQKYKD